MSSQFLAYRPEIDGLRTLAVFSVMIYHAKFLVGGATLLPGGFLGVDVFFVISGFLITSLLRDELAATGRLSLVGFYGRRIRRLLPALMLVMLASLPVAWEMLLPQQLLEFSLSQFASLFFVSNIYWDVSLQEYGAESALLTPFLHTWSLAVEEQFYLLFPLLFWWGSRLGISILRLLFLLVAATSLGAAIWLGPRDPSFAFYMLPTRFWELLAGSLLALWTRQAEIKGVARHLPFVGMAMIVASVAWVEFSPAHPGAITLLPVLGTVLIIGWASQENAVIRLLSSRPFVSFGLISYALYLWHYPIFAFGRMLNDQPGLGDKVGWIALTIACSVASYWLVEKPLRNRARVSGKAFALVTGAALLVLLGVNGSWIKADGFPERADYVRQLVGQSEKLRLQQGDRWCHSGGIVQPYFSLKDSCDFNEFPGAPYIVLVGDSHAGQLGSSAYHLARHNGMNFMQVTQAGCSHLSYQPSRNHCQFRANRLRAKLRRYPGSTIIYSSRLPQYLELSAFDGREGYQEVGYEEVDPAEVAREQPLVRQGLHKTLGGWLEDGHELVLVYPVPEQGFHVAHQLVHQRPPIMGPEDLPVLSTSLPVFRERAASAYAALDAVAGDGVFRVYPERIFCRTSTGRCLASEGERLYYVYDNHVSRLGGELILRQVAEVLGLDMPPEYRQ